MWRRREIKERMKINKEKEKNKEIIGEKMAEERENIHEEGNLYNYEKWKIPKVEKNGDEEYEWKF